MSAWCLFAKMYYVNMFTLIFILLYTSSVEGTAKLNVPRVLLPVFKDLSINFTLEISGTGCYEWSTSRPDLLSIKEVYENKANLCSKQAVITVLTKELTRKTAIIIAEDIGFHQTLRADVILDVISQLKIVTMSRELYMEEPPQRFEVRAYDKKGNEFTTLVGVEFLWIIHGVIGENKRPVVRLMTFSESPYETPSSVAEFDSIGKHGHIALLEGIKTGSAQVYVQLPHSEYSFVQPADVQVVVVANLLLEPTSVYILPGDTVHFQLFQIRQGKRHEILFTNKQFILVSQDNSIASVVNGKVKGLELGKVEVTIHDTYMPDNGTIKLPSALVVVTEPHYMTLSILPYFSWSLTVGQEAVIVPELYAVNSHKIWIGENTVISTKVPQSIFLVTKSKNGTVTGNAYKTGSGKVIAQLLSHTGAKIEAENTIDVYPRVEVSPETLFLPWVAEYTPKLTSFSLKVSGGDNNYAWESADTSIVEVAQNGSLTFNGPGFTTVTVFMKKNKNCRASAKIHLHPPDEMSIYPDVSEGLIGEDLHLNIELFGKIKIQDSFIKVPFNMCGFLHFVVSPQYPFVNGKDQDRIPKGNACAVKTVKSNEFGLAKVMVKLNTDEKELFATTILVAYRPLISLQPFIEEDIVLAIESSYDIVFSGGPLPIFGRIRSQINVSNEIIEPKENIMIPELYVINVNCKNIGTSILELHLDTNPIGFPGIKFIKNVIITCNVPHRIEIHNSLKEAGCCEIFPQRFISQPSNILQFYLTLYDDKGKAFKNATSISFKWKFDNNTIARFEQDDSIQLEEKIRTHYKSAISHYITIHTFDIFGDVVGKGFMFGPKNVVTFKQVAAERIDFTPSSGDTSFMLSVVQEPTVEPLFLSLFNHPNNIGYLKIKGGSGHFNFELSSPFVVIKYNYKTRTAEISPLHEGSGEIVLRDKCLPDLYPLKIEIQVISIASVLISSVSKVQEGQSIKVILRALDKDEKPLAIPTMSFAKLGLKMKVSDSSVAEFLERPNKAQIDYLKGTVEVPLKGKKVGETYISAVWMNISSNVMNIQVFPKIKITPRDITLAIGSEIQLKIKGGPSADAHIQFVINDPSILTVFSTDSIVKGIRPGKTLVTAMSMGYQGEVYSRDAIEIQVIPLVGIHIVAPTTTLGLGNTMPVWASGIPHAITPLLLGSITPPLQLKWQVSVPNVIQIKDTLYNTKIQISSENKLSVRVHALNPGLASLELTVVGRNPDKSIFVFNSSLEIAVRHKLEWIQPNVEFPHILMAPNTAYNLKANTLAKAFQTIQSIDVWNPNPETPLLSVTQNGLVKVGPNTGMAVIATKSSDVDLSTNEITLTVLVKPVHYLMINIATALETSEEVKALPRGLYLNMTISYHDQHGYEFSVPPQTKPVYHCNICSKVHVEYSGFNHSIITSLANAGNVILRIYDTIGQTEIEDYIKIPVVNFITPQRVYLTVGEIICYWTPLVSQNGIWSTDNPNVLNIDINGIAYAERTGASSVTYSSSYPEPDILASLSVEVLPLQSFMFGPSATRSITNSVGSNYLIPVFLINEKQKKEPFYSKNCNNSRYLHYTGPPFECELHYTSAARHYPLEEIFAVTANFDFGLGSYVCLITPLKGPSEERSKIESNITLSVTNRKTNYDTYFLNFYPQFFSSVDTIEFTRHSLTSPVKLTGSTTVLQNIFVLVGASNSQSVNLWTCTVYLKIESSSHKIIAISPTFSENSQTLRFYVRSKLQDNEIVCEEENIYVLITCPLTMQKEKIRIVFNFKEPLPIHLRMISSVFTLFKDIVTYILLGSLGILNSVIVWSFIIIFILHKFWNHMLPENQGGGMNQQEMRERIQQLQDQSSSLVSSDNTYTTGRPLLASPRFLRSTSASRNISLSPPLPDSHFSRKSSLDTPRLSGSMYPGYSGTIYSESGSQGRGGYFARSSPESTQYPRGTEGNHFSEKSSSLDSVPRLSGGTYSGYAGDVNSESRSQGRDGTLESMQYPRGTEEHHISKKSSLDTPRLSGSMYSGYSGTIYSEHGSQGKGDTLESMQYPRGSAVLSDTPLSSQAPGLTSTPINRSLHKHHISKKSSLDTPRLSGSMYSGYSGTIDSEHGSQGKGDTLESIQYPRGSAEHHISKKSSLDTPRLSGSMYSGYSGTIDSDHGSQGKGDTLESIQYPRGSAVLSDTPLSSQAPGLTSTPINRSIHSLHSL